MDTNTAILRAYDLQVMWVGTTDIQAGRGFDLDRIHRSMLQEYRFLRTRLDRKAVAKETKGQLVLLGKIRKALGNRQISVTERRGLIVA